VTGCDLVAPYAYLGVGGALVGWSSDSDAAPTESNLGDVVDLWFVTEDE
jgi:hypothetical protein